MCLEVERKDRICDIGKKFTDACPAIFLYNPWLGLQRWHVDSVDLVLQLRFNSTLLLILMFVSAV